MIAIMARRPLVISVAMFTVYAAGSEAVRTLKPK
jgi:hypothetical protein